MKLSRKFLSDYIDLPSNLSINDIAEDMTSIGNEYDYAGKLIDCTNLVVGKVIKCVNHPDSDHLKLCEVDIGSEVLKIVCGAPNVRVGLKVIVAKDGAQLPGGTIKKGMIRNEESNGMLCSLAELGLDNKYLDEKDKNGIHEFSEDVEIGTDPIKALGLDDEVIDFELTANRADLLSILGMAYEIGAIYKKDVKDIDLSYDENGDITDDFKIDIKTNDCSVFLAKKVKNVVIKESPKFIKERLIASGIRPINNVVDISNYVMLETGQPLHFYDAKKLGNKLIVRNANDGEKLVTLDGNMRILNSDDIVIANDKEAVGLAGVMGGMSTEVEDDTKDIIIESAIFDKVKIRKTSKKILRSEASNRFEKGLDPNRTYMAIERSCALLSKYASASIVGNLVKYDKAKKEDKKIDIELSKVDKVLGIHIPKDEIISILKSLKFDVIENNDNLTVIVPSRRLDVNIKEDLIEEIGRIYGMDNIKGKLPVLNIKTSTFDNTKREIKNKLVNLGLNETLSYSLIPNANVHDYTTDEFTEITLNDPMSEERSTLRYSLLYSLKEIYLYNKARNNSDICIFEIGKGFYKEDKDYKEELKLAVLMTGDYYLDINNKKVDFYVIKGVLEELLDYLGYNNRYSIEVSNNLPKQFHPYQSADIIMQGKKIGVIGKLHPNEIKDDVYAFEINLDKLLVNHPSKMIFKEIPKYPEVKKDVAFIVNKNITSKEIEEVITKAGGSLLKNIKLFDIYTGEKINENEKSLAYSLTFGADKTLTEEEVMEKFNNIIKKVTDELSATLRDS